MDDTNFPNYLLSQSIKDKIDYFRNYTLVHPLLEQIYEDLSHLIKYSAPGSLIFLYGPSGVGKTTLIQKLYKDIVEETYPELLENPAKLPAVLTRAVASDTSTFNWKDYFQRLLIETNDFLPAKMASDNRWEKIQLQNSQMLKTNNTSSSNYRKAVENTIKYRKPSIIFIDEAQEIGMVSTSRKLLRQTNVIKSLAEETQINYVLSGTYELLPLRNLNGQLSRRSLEVHFPRYDASNIEHRKIFRTVLRTFQNHLPLEQTPDLVSHWEYIFERSIGCIGTVKDWLTRSYSWSLKKNRQTLTLEDLEKREPSIAQSLRKLEEILEGENKLKIGEEERQKLRHGLGLDISEELLCPQNKSWVYGSKQAMINL